MGILAVIIGPDSMFVLKMLVCISSLLFSAILVYIMTVRLTRQPKTIGLFHPYWYHSFSNSGGGGERVLWTIVKSLTSKYPGHLFTVYTV